jgi:NAD+ synthase (glutamine-hydrolysing)
MALRVAGAQLNLTVGDIPGNEAKIAAAMERAQDSGADVLLVPELAISGYPPEDLVLRRDFVEANLAALRRLARSSGSMTTVIGFVDFATGRGSGALDAEPRAVANAAALVSDGELRGVYHKVLLPNYGVFDEDRYFVEGADPDRTWDIEGVPVGVSVCEDIWLPDGPPSQQAAHGARVLLNINASPFHRGKAAAREEMLAERARGGGAPVVYLNLVGGQDELVFDGASVVIGRDGELIHRSPQFEEDFFVVEVPTGEEPVVPGSIAPLLEPTEEIYRALTAGLADYCRKNGFEQVVIGLSGGVDSSLVAYLAADALGPENVLGVRMPYRTSSPESLDHAKLVIDALGVRSATVDITAAVDGLATAIGGDPSPGRLGNIMARARMITLFDLSAAHRALPLGTGNKTERLLGYFTWHADDSPPVNPIGDLFKTQVWALARHVGVPDVIVSKPASADLIKGQTDEGDFGISYPRADAILHWILLGYRNAEIGALGFSEEEISLVRSRLDTTHWKRRLPTVAMLSGTAIGEYYLRPVDY